MRCFVGSLMLGMATGQSLHFIRGLQVFRLGDAAGLSFLVVLGVVGIAPAIVDSVRGEGRARTRGIVVLAIAAILALLVTLGSYLTPAVGIES